MAGGKPYSYSDTSVTYSDWTGYSGATAATTTIWYQPIVRRILVAAPKNWDKKRCLAFAKLINNKTNTGWNVEMIIKGEITITDPDIETRTMKEFLPLLKKRATKADINKIDKFIGKIS